MGLDQTMKTYFRERYENVQATFQIATIVLVTQENCLKSVGVVDGSQWPK